MTIEFKPNHDNVVSDIDYRDVPESGLPLRVVRRINLCDKASLQDPQSESWHAIIDVYDMRFDEPVLIASIPITESETGNYHYTADEAERKFSEKLGDTSSAADSIHADLTETWQQSDAGDNEYITAYIKSLGSFESTVFETIRSAAMANIFGRLFDGSGESPFGRLLNRNIDDSAPDYDDNGLPGAFRGFNPFA